MSSDRIIRFPIRRARAGGLYCRPLDIVFPAVLRIVETVTERTIASLSRTDIEPGTFVRYALVEDEISLPMERSVSIVRSLPPTDTDSLVVRRHASAFEAGAYLEGALDTGLDDGLVEPICSTDAGLFTILPCPTKSHWPGPLIIHVASVPSSSGLAEEEIWCEATAPDGTTAPLED